MTQSIRHIHRLCLAPLALGLLASCGEAPVPEELIEPLPLPTPAAAAEAEPVPAPPISDQLAPGYAPLNFDLGGTGWLVIAVDGVPVADMQDDLANIYFGQSMIRWRGCNAKEALFIPLSGSFALGPAKTRDAACGEQKIDSVMDEVIAARPLIGRNREGKVMLAAKGHALTLSQVDSGPKDDAAPPMDAAPFVMRTADAPDARPVISFSPLGFTVWMDCADAIKGRGRIVDGRLRAGSIEVTECETHRPTATKSLADFLRSSPYVARGADGAMLFSDGHQVMAAQQCTKGSAACRREAGQVMTAAEEEAPPAPGEPASS